MMRSNCLLMEVCSWMEASWSTSDLNLITVTSSLLITLALRQGWQLYVRGEPVWLLCLLFALVCMLTDGDRLLHAPRAIWVYFWLPVGVLIGRQAGNAPADTRRHHRRLGPLAANRSE